MANRPLPSVEYLRQRLDYNPETGVMTWKARPLSDFVAAGDHAARLCKAWNTRNANKPAGRINAGRRVLSIDGYPYVFARVAMAISAGSWPSGDVDHIDGNPLHDRLCNLRDVPRHLNNRNRAPSTSKPVGVTRRTPNCWEAVMSIHNKKVRIGYFRTEADAVAARAEAGRKHGFTDRHYGK